MNRSQSRIFFKFDRRMYARVVLPERSFDASTHAPPGMNRWRAHLCDLMFHILFSFSKNTYSRRFYWVFFAFLLFYTIFVGVFAIYAEIAQIEIIFGFAGVVWRSCAWPKKFYMFRNRCSEKRSINLIGRVLCEMTLGILIASHRIFAHNFFYNHWWFQFCVYGAWYGRFDRTTPHMMPKYNIKLFFKNWSISLLLHQTFTKNWHFLKWKMSVEMKTGFKNRNFIVDSSGS